MAEKNSRNKSFRKMKIFLFLLFITASERTIFMLATVASLTSANRIKRRAAEMGVFSSIIQTPQSLAKDGCGYSLRFDDSAEKYILSSAEEIGVRIRSLYIESAFDGEKRYILKRGVL